MLSGCRVVQVAHRCDAVSAHSDITYVPGCASAIHDAGVGDEHIVVGRLSVASGREKNCYSERTDASDDLFEHGREIQNRDDTRSDALAFMAQELTWDRRLARPTSEARCCLGLRPGRT